jgi:multimeric flavodoxin WrbA
MGDGVLVYFGYPQAHEDDAERAVRAGLELIMMPTLLHHGMIVVGLPYSFQGQSTMDEISGCSPYGASTITKPDGSRMPSENENADAQIL